MIFNYEVQGLSSIHMLTNKQHKKEKGKGTQQLPGKRPKQPTLEKQKHEKNNLKPLNLTPTAPQ